MIDRLNREELKGCIEATRKMLEASKLMSTMKQFPDTAKTRWLLRFMLEKEKAALWNLDDSMFEVTE